MPGSWRWLCWNVFRLISGSPSCCTTDSPCRSPKWHKCLETSETAARQLASRARKAVTASPPPEPDPSHSEVVGKLMAAMAEGDLDAVVALLHPDVTFTGDSDGKAPTAVQVIHGADKVVRFMLGLAQRYGPSMYTAYELGFINGELGIYTAGLPASDGYREMLPRIMAMTVRDGKVCALWDIANPEKFTGSPLRTHPLSKERGTHHPN